LLRAEHGYGRAVGFEELFEAEAEAVAVGGFEAVDEGGAHGHHVEVERVVVGFRAPGWGFCGGGGDWLGWC
jgi:hypothetical protein